MQYARILLTVCRSGVHQFENLKGFNDFPFAGKLYLIINQIFHMLETCVLWVGKFSTRLNISFYLNRFHLLENCISLFKTNLKYAWKQLTCVGQVSTNSKLGLDCLIFNSLDNCNSLKIKSSICWSTAYFGSASFSPDGKFGLI